MFASICISYAVVAANWFTKRCMMCFTPCPCVQLCQVDNEHLADKSHLDTIFDTSLRSSNLKCRTKAVMLSPWILDAPNGLVFTNHSDLSERWTFSKRFIQVFQEQVDAIIRVVPSVWHFRQPELSLATQLLSMPQPGNDQ
jgi:hypothetical protein